MSSSSRPWQFEWKRPQWQSLRNGGKDNVPGRALCVNSAQISSEEIPTHYSVPTSEKGSLLLTLTLFSSSNNEVGDLLLLELLCQKSPEIANAPNENEEGHAVEVLISHAMQWPESALFERSDSEKKNAKPWHQNLFGLLGDGKSTNENLIKSAGVVSACFCRKPPGNDRAAAVDALDAVTFMSFGLAPNPMTSRLRPEIENSKEMEQSTGLNELLLACLCADGKVYVYSPWELLQPMEADKEDDLTMGLASLLMGENLHNQMKQSILPLSKPTACISLTVPLKRNDRETVEKLPTNVSSPSSASKASPDEDVPIWDPLVWDSTVEPSSTIYRTHDNVPSLCVPAFEFIAIGGRGQRAFRRHKLQAPVSSEIPSDATQNPDGQTQATVDKGTANNAYWTCEGGFITFLSVRQFSETRTVFIPFAPQKLSPFVWGGMCFVLVLGEGIAVAIRVDVWDCSSVLCGEPPPAASISPNDDLRKVEGVTGPKSHIGVREGDVKKCNVQRFQILPIRLPGINQRSHIPIMTGSTTFVSPPGLAMMYKENAELLLVKRSFQCVDRVLTENAGHLFKNYRRSHEGRTTVIETTYATGHQARIPNPDPSAVDGNEFEGAWCHLGQGWCLVGSMRRTYFVCFEGATTLRGGFVHELGQLDTTIVQGSIQALACDIQPVNPFLMAEKNYQFAEGGSLITSAEDAMLPFTSQNEMRPKSGLGKQDKLPITREEKSPLDDIVVDALESISNLSYRDNLDDQTGPVMSPIRRHISFSNQEKSEILLRNCSSWRELERQIWLEGQVPAVIVYIGSAKFVMTLRKIVVENGVATPFHEVLSWLASRKDYFTAASLALDLLRDVEALRHLWKVFEKIDDDDERTKLEGLLDGILPIWGGVESPKKSTLTKLADMTVGCLIKGGFSMSQTLENFLRRNQHYDTSRAGLMLVATTACCVAEDESAVASAMGSGYQIEEESDHDNNILWPVRCLLQIGVARNYLSTVLLLLNATIPNELRRRQTSGFPAICLQSMNLCKSLVKLIVASSPFGAECLLGLVDEQERTRYWLSLEHDTQLELSLITINAKCPMLRQAEVRSWVLQNLHMCIQEEAASGVNVAELMPTPWLKQLCQSCLLNAGCNVDTLVHEYDVAEEVDGYDDGLKRHINEIKVTRAALRAADGCGGLDFDICIPSLLILERRSNRWADEAGYSTQSILNAACCLAGRVTTEEPYFAIDSATLMKQCALAGNVSAGANLVGGKTGLVLECCSILIEEAGITMNEAEDYLMRENSDVVPTMEEQWIEISQFQPNMGHRHVLWLLDEHVLSVRTYGEFHTSQMRGRIDPVFASKMCFRTWLGLTKARYPEASKWLISWLRKHLGMENGGISSRSLVCAAMVRALLWNSENTGKSVLAEQLDIESRFLVQLCQSCWNLIESLPPAIANKLLDAQAKEMRVTEGGSRSMPPHGVDGLHMKQPVDYNI